MNDGSKETDHPHPAEAGPAERTDHAIDDPYRRTNDRARSSLWSRLWRSFRPASHGSLREDLADALLTDSGRGMAMAFSPEERAMLHNILRLREVRLEDVMVPRAEIDAVDQSMPIGDLLNLFEETGRSRMPVYRENLDDPRGMVHIRDLLAHITKKARGRRRAPARSTSKNGGSNGKSGANGKYGAFDFTRVDFTKTIADSGIIRKVLFVPPSMLASDLMERMQALRTQMALVIDEYGGTDGLASLEDIVEMVVGDIADEHDDEETMITRSSDDIFLADAKAELEDLAEMIGPDFDIREQIEDVDTLGGLLFSALGRVPARGEVVQALPAFEFHVLDADPRRIKRVRIVRRRPSARRRAVKADGETAAQSQRTAERTDDGASDT